jgi:hypothetical protein
MTTETWTLTAPGILSLAATGITITWDGVGSFMVRWNGNLLGAAGNMNGAKEYAMQHLRKLLDMGIEP